MNSAYSWVKSEGISHATGGLKKCSLFDSSAFREAINYKHLTIKRTRYKWIKK
jgi:hypothetical protein